MKWKDQTSERVERLLVWLTPPEPNALEALSETFQMTVIVTYHLHQPPEKAMKQRILIYYATDLKPAQELALKERAAKNVGYTRDATRFIPDDVEPCDEVVIMPDVPAHYRRVLEESYMRKIKPAPAPEATATLIEGAEHRDTSSTASVETPVKVAPASVGELEVMTKKELRDYAQNHGIVLDESLSRRDELIAAISKAQA